MGPLPLFPCLPESVDIYGVWKAKIPGKDRNEMTKYMILKSQLDKTINEAVFAAKGGKEICGLLINNGYFIELLQTRNKNKKNVRSAYYYKEVRHIETVAKELGHEIVGTFHSHPLYIAKPGEKDVANAVDDSLMLIIDVLGRKVELWHIKNRKKRKTKFLTLTRSRS